MSRRSHERLCYGRPSPSLALDQESRDPLSPKAALIEFILQEWILTFAGVGFVLTTAYTRHLPSYSTRELEVIFVLLSLFITINGLQKSGLISRISRHLERGDHAPIKFVLATFFLSMFITNDVAVIAIVPMTMASDIERKDILVILEALAANAGSALTPFGNPQNLFIYWFYNLHIKEFIFTIAPFSILLMIVIAFPATFINSREHRSPEEETRTKKSSYIYGGLLIATLLTVLHILPIITGFLVLIYAILFDRDALRVDYILLISFFLFFGLAENMRQILGTEIQHSRHVFILSAISSQLMSNVPATLLFAKLTQNWQALLWGANAGGFGSLFGSLANLIAYRLYVTHEGTESPALFTVKFLAFGYTALLLATALYFSPLR